MNAKTRTGRKSRRHWIDAGLSHLGEGGADDLRVETLAPFLGTTKGSFYYHFTNRAEFLDALIERWKAASLADVPPIAAQGRAAALKRLKAAWRGRDDGNAETLHRAAKGAIRAWAHRDPEVMEALRVVDVARLEYYMSLFEDCGWPRKDAHARAFLLLSSLVGVNALSPTLGLDMTERRALEAGDILIIAPQD